MKTMHVRLPDPIADAVMEKAQAGNQSISGFIRDAVIAAIIACPSDAIATRTPKEKGRNEKEGSEEKVKKEKGTLSQVRAREGENVPPTLEECQEYAATKPAFGSMSVLEFYDHYTSNGWLVGGKSIMRNWKSAMRNWVRRSKRIHGRQGAVAEKEAAAKENERRNREKAQRERLEAAKDPLKWGLCAERCANFKCGKCSEGAKWPPQLNDWPIPPEQCSRFSAATSTALQAARHNGGEDGECAWEGGAL